MAKSRKRDTFNKVSAVKSNSRDRIGTPKASFVITPKTERKPKYKENWSNVATWNDVYVDDYFGEESFE